MPLVVISTQRPSPPGQAQAVADRKRIAQDQCAPVRTAGSYRNTSSFLHGAHWGLTDACTRGRTDTPEDAPGPCRLPSLDGPQGPPGALSAPRVACRVYFHALGLMKRTIRPQPNRAPCSAGMCVLWVTNSPRADFSQTGAHRVEMPKDPGPWLSRGSVQRPLRSWGWLSSCVPGRPSSGLGRMGP